MTDVTCILSAIESGDRRGGSHWDSRGRFFAVTAEAMRRILIDRARAHGAEERGGSWRRVDLEPTEISLETVPGELMELDEALTRFRSEEPGKARLAELRFFLADLPVVGSNSEAIRNDIVFLCQPGEKFGRSRRRAGRRDLAWL